MARPWWSDGYVPRPRKNVDNIPIISYCFSSANPPPPSPIARRLRPAEGWRVEDCENVYKCLSLPKRFMEYQRLKPVLPALDPPQGGSKPVLSVLSAVVSRGPRDETRDCERSERARRAPRKKRTAGLAGHRSPC